MAKIAKVDMSLKYYNFGDQKKQDHSWLASGITKQIEGTAYVSGGATSMALNTQGMSQIRFIYLRSLSAISGATLFGYFSGHAVSSVSCPYRVSDGRSIAFEPGFRSTRKLHLFTGNYGVRFLYSVFGV